MDFFCIWKVIIINWNPCLWSLSSLRFCGLSSTSNISIRVCFIRFRLNSHWSIIPLLLSLILLTSQEMTIDKDHLSITKWTQNVIPTLILHIVKGRIILCFCQLIFSNSEACRLRTIKDNILNLNITLPWLQIDMVIFAGDMTPLINFKILMHWTEP